MPSPPSSYESSTTDQRTLSNATATPLNRANPAQSTQPYPTTQQFQQYPFQPNPYPQNPGSGPQQAIQGEKKKGAAQWRRQKGGKVRGLARRKGEKNPFKWGFDFDDSVLGHPAMKNWTELPPLGSAPKVQKPRAQGGGEEEEKKGCVVM